MSTPKNRGYAFARGTALVALCAAAGYFIWRSAQPPIPVLVVETHGAVAGTLWNRGVWYWIDDAGTPAARLVRSNGGAAVKLAADSGVTDFSVGDTKIAWTVREGTSWLIKAAAPDGSVPATVWTGEQEPHGICVAGSRIYWLQQLPPAARYAEPLPPLSNTVRLQAVSLTGGAPTSVGDIMEMQGAKVLGEHDGQVYVKLSRGSLQNVTVIVRVPAAGGAAQRLAAVHGEQDALVSRNGILYWTAASRESADVERVACVARLSSNGATEWLDDWLPSGGRLCEGADGVYYLGGNVGTGSAWPIQARRQLPEGFTLPLGFSALAVGSGEALVQEPGVAKSASLYRIPLR